MTFPFLFCSKFGCIFAKLVMQAIEELPFIEWLKGAMQTTEEGLQVLQNNDVIYSPNLLPWKSPVLVQRQCYTKLLGQMKTWDTDDVKRLVVSGTPGIGKTTLIYFVLWKFFQSDLKYDTVVLGEASRLISIQRDGTCRNHQTGDLPMLRNSLGLFDIAPTGTVKDGEKSLNNQQANTYFRVYHMLVVATSGFNLGEFRKQSPIPPVEYLPAWGPDMMTRYCKLRGIGNDPELCELCGNCIPRLVLQCSQDQQSFKERVEDFCHAMFGNETSGGTQTNVKDAHTMVVLEASDGLKEPGVEPFYLHLPRESIKKGDKAGFVSKFVQTKVFDRMKKDPGLDHLIRRMPEIARYYFQEMVLNALVGYDGLTLTGDKSTISLKFSRSETFTHHQIKPQQGVLYVDPPQADRMRSVDGLGWSGDTLYLLQPTIGQEHYEIVASHLNDNLQTPLPEGIKKVAALYIRPRHQGSFYLRQRKNQPGIRKQFASKSYSQQVVAVPGLIAECSEELQRVLC